MTYVIRVKDVGNWGFFTQADHWIDHTIQSELPISQLADHLARHGFKSEKRWIMPAAILWIKEK